MSSAYAYNFLTHITNTVDLDTADIRLVGIDATQMGAGNGGAITGATNATPIVVSSASHGLANGERVVIAGVAGNTAANGVFLVANVAAGTFELTDPITGADVAGNGTYTSGGHWLLCDSTINDLADIPAAARSTDLIAAEATGFTLAGGNFDGANSPYTVTGCGVGDEIHFWCWYAHNAAEASALLLYFDGDDTGLPTTGNGNDITYTLNASGIAYLYK